MTQAIKLGQFKLAKPSVNYLAFWPGLQAPTDTAVLDRSGYGANAGLQTSVGSGSQVFYNAGTSGIWKVANWIKVFNSSVDNVNSPYSGSLYCPNSKFQNWDFSAKDSLCVGFRFQISNLAASGFFYLCGTIKSGTAGSLGIGVIQGTTAGSNASKIGVQARYVPAGGAETQTAITYLIANVIDGTEHQLVLFLDGGTGDLYAYIDGVLDTKIPNWVPVGANLKAPTTGTSGNLGFGIGGAQILNDARNGEGLFRDIHILRRPNPVGNAGSNMPANFASRIPLLYAMKFKPMPTEWWD